jgi:hypothetical protein
VYYLSNNFINIYFYKKCQFSDDQLNQYYGEVRNKYIKVMGFDYDAVKFNEIADEMKPDSPLVSFSFGGSFINLYAGLSKKWLLLGFSSPFFRRFKQKIGKNGDRDRKFGRR